ncbi:MAG: response regulator [Defluviitaleaceae bacterium]|nr:response regulator [Defluviitaleaceae bacterium]
MYTLALVDDETYILELLKDVFPWAEMGFKIVAYCSASHEMLAYLQENPVDVLLTDIILGGETGLELSEAARKIKPNIIIVILSAHSEFEYARTAMRLNIFDYLLKPITHEGVTKCFAAIRDKLDIARNLHKTNQDENYRLNLIKSYIDKHVGEDISLESMAALIAMNPAYFSRFFKRHQGMSFHDYLVARRMEKAIDLLQDPRNKVFEICAKVGYYGKQSFYKQFRKHTGLTPVQYRDRILQTREDEPYE